MNRQQFNSNNKVGQTFTFQKSGSTASFTPSITIGGSKRVSYNFGDGIQTAGNSVTYLGFSSDTSIRTITVKTNKIKDITALNFFNDNVYGNLNLTGLTSLGGVFSVALNSKLTGITNPISSSVFTNYECWGCDITGQLDLSTLTGLGGNVSLQDNLNLTGVTFPNTNTLFNRLTIYQSNLIGNLNLTGLTALGGNFGVFTNPNLTGITHGPTSQTFTNYVVYNCNLIGNLDLIPLSGLGGQFVVRANPLLTGITHVFSPQTFTSYRVDGCGLVGNLDLTPLSGISGLFTAYNNTSLTGITHAPSNNTFTFYSVFNTNLYGNFDLSPLSGLGNDFQVHNNPSLTGITHSPSTNTFNSYNIRDNNITGTHDISMFSNFGGPTTASTCYLLAYQNSGMTNIIFPTTIKYFKNSSNSEDSGAFSLYSCNLDYVDFKPLSGATLLTGSTQGNPRISLRDNGMIADDVNRILVDFSGNASYNPTGWSNINLNIGGTNADPDSSSGGYDGLTAITTLTGLPYNWTISY
jgi:hypothetical protein